MAKMIRDGNHVRQLELRSEKWNIRVGISRLKDKIDHGISFFQNWGGGVLAGTILVLGTTTAEARLLDKAEIETAAANCLASDSLVRHLLPERKVVSLETKGPLWIVALAPSGHLVLAGSDLAEPVVGFSAEDYVEPEPGSPAAALYTGKAQALEMLEADSSASPNSKWLLLLENRIPRADAVTPPSSAILVKPFMASHYNQWQPYNDYAPIYNTWSYKEVYRGRVPCGCVPTAASQVLRHFRWPAIIGGVRTVDHTCYSGWTTDYTCTIRFDGRAPFDWNACKDDYIYSSNGSYDLRGKLAESNRYPIARLVMWADSLANVSFSSGGSSANYGTVVRNLADWYISGTWLDAYEDDLSPVVSNLQNGIPVPVELYGHQVVGHGWAESGGERYVYLNFGWGGSSDGYYNVQESAAGCSIEGFYVGQLPRAKPQFAPLPAVTTVSNTLSWHFPAFHESALTGFQVTVSELAEEPADSVETFSSPAGTLSGQSVSVGKDTEFGGNETMLIFQPLWAGAYTFSKAVTLTSASSVSFKIRGYYSLNAGIRLEARFNGGDWETLSAPVLPDSGDSGWKTVSIYLGKRGGQTMQLRLSGGQSESGSYYPSGRVFIDDVKVSNVLVFREMASFDLPAATRDVSIPVLEPGGKYSACIRPVLSSNALAPAETSDSIDWSVEGMCREPAPAELVYQTTDIVYSATDTSGIWSSSGTQDNTTTVRGAWSASIEATLPGPLSASSELAFSWSATGYYGSDSFSVTFTDESGMRTVLWEENNYNDQPVDQPVSLSLAALAGQTGTLAISFSHAGSQYTMGSYGGRIIAPKITNVSIPAVPTVEYRTVERTALGIPSVVSVLTTEGQPIPEGFFRECARGRSIFCVECSRSVVSLRALPSHLSLVPDSAITVHPVGTGKFVVEIDASVIPDDADRSRMILTLEATDSNGTAACKDLSLRFSSETASEAAWNGQSPWPVEQTVHFDPNGGICNPPSHVYVIGEPYGWLPEVSNGDLPFAGWTDRETGERVTETNEVTHAEMRFLVAQWGEEAVDAARVADYSLDGQSKLYTIKFVGRAGVTYELQQSPTLETRENWSTVKTIIPERDGEIVITEEIPAGWEQGFFRVEVKGEGSRSSSTEVRIAE